jgi:hypothetical protein
MQLLKWTRALATGLCAAAATFGGVANAGTMSVQVDMPGLSGDYRVHDWWTYYTDQMRRTTVNLGAPMTSTKSVELFLEGVVAFPVFENKNIGVYTGEVSVFMGFGRGADGDLIQWGQYLGEISYSGAYPSGDMYWKYEIDAQGKFALDMFYRWPNADGLGVLEGIGNGTLSFAPSEQDHFQSDTLLQDGSVRVTGAKLIYTGITDAVVPDPVSVPEPSVAFLLVGGLFSIGVARRRAKKSD